MMEPIINLLASMSKTGNAKMRIEAHLKLIELSETSPLAAEVAEKTKEGLVYEMNEAPKIQQRNANCITWAAAALVLGYLLKSFFLGEP